jgi:competence protein ComEC
MRASPGDAGALMSGLVTGEDGGLSENANDAFVNSGTTHITAISGANFSLLIVLIGVLVTGAARRSLLFVAGASTAIWLYAFMVGLQPSALRAALLATAVLIGRWIGRKPDLLTLTILLAAIQIVFRPQDFATLAFQLSVAATVALILVFEANLEGANRPWFVSLCLAVLAAQLATIPILAWQIGTLTGVGLIANLVVGQLAELAFPIALIGGLAGQVNAALGNAILVPAIALSGGILSYVEWVDRHFPGSMALGQPTIAAISAITVACWTGIFLLSGDLRRTTRHAAEVVRTW